MAKSNTVPRPSLPDMDVVAPKGLVGDVEQRQRPCCSTAAQRTPANQRYDGAPADRPNWQGAAVRPLSRGAAAGAAV